MPKKHKLASQTFSLPALITNWDICVLCQETGGTLINPSAAGYETLATNLSSLHELNKLPLNINVSRLNDGNGIQETLVAHSARWHKTCYVLCNATKVQRARVQLDKASEHLSQSPHKHHIRGRTTDADSCASATEGACQQAWFFCDTSAGEFHKAEALEFDTRVRHIATELRDTNLLAKLSAGDMVAIDAVYHLKCLTAFYNRHRSQQRSSSQSCGQISLQSLALAEAVPYIEEYRQVDGDLNHVFKLTNLKKLNSECLQKLGGDINANIHSNRFTQKLLQHIPTLEAHNSKSGTVLSFKEQVGDALLDACEFDSDDEAVMLMRVARLIRKDVFENKYRFCDSLCDEQYDNLPTSLSALVRMILVGLNNAGQHIGDYNSCNAISSITQLLVYNVVNRSRRDSGGVRHNLDRETVLPLYLGLLIHNRTRKRDLIDNLFDKGLCVSYDRVLQFSTDEANSVIDKYGDSVCPSSLKEQLFTTGNLDNIDHHPSSTSSRDSFHGTAISVTQHITNDSQGVVRVPREIPENSLQAVKID